MVFYIRKCMSSLDQIVIDDVNVMFCLLKRYLESSSLYFEVGGRSDAVLRKAPQSSRYLLQYKLQITATDVFNSVSQGEDMYAYIDTLNFTLQMTTVDSRRNLTRTLSIMTEQKEGESCFEEQTEDVLATNFFTFSRPHPCVTTKAYSPSNVPRERCKNISVMLLSLNEGVNITWDCQPIGKSEMKLPSSGYSTLKTFALLIHVPMLLLAFVGTREIFWPIGAY